MVEWIQSDSLVGYSEAVAFMEQRVAAIAEGRADEAVWLLEHPAMYTAGTSSRPEECHAYPDLPVHQSGRGGRYTYHGPGQRIAYVMLDLNKRGRDVRKFVQGLENWVIAALRECGVHAETRSDRVGVWTVGNSRLSQSDHPLELKLAAVGIRLRKWVSFHGISINVCPDLSHYSGIIPCGIAEFGVTSLHQLGHELTMRELDFALERTFKCSFPDTMSH